MATEFEELCEKCKDIYLHSDVKKRRAKMDKWCKQAVKELQAALPGEVEGIRKMLETDAVDENGVIKEATKTSWHNRRDCLVLEVRWNPRGHLTKDELSEPIKSNDSWFKKLLSKLRLR